MVTLLKEVYARAYSPMEVTGYPIPLYVTVSGIINKLPAPDPVWANCAPPFTIL